MGGGNSSFRRENSRGNQGICEKLLPAYAQRDTPSYFMRGAFSVPWKEHPLLCSLQLPTEIVARTQREKRQGLLFVSCCSFPMIWKTQEKVSSFQEDIIRKHLCLDSQLTHRQHVRFFSCQPRQWMRYHKAVTSAPLENGSRLMGNVMHEQE